MARIVLTTDTHFNHTKMTEWGRPEDFEARIVKGLRMVDHKDTVIHMGDVCVGNDADSHSRFFNSLPPLAKRILIRGNHDRKSDNWYLDKGWDFICDTFTLGKIIFSHAPQMPDYRYDMNIHGHTHGNEHRIADDMKYYGFKYDPSWHKELALENTNYQPVLLSTFLKNNPPDATWAETREIVQNLQKIKNSMVDLDPDIAKLINDNFEQLI